MTSTWAHGTLADVATVIGRGIPPRYAASGDTIVLNQKCIRDGRINESLARRHDSESRKVGPDKILRVGDVLVNSTGVGTLGRTAPVRELTGTTTVDSHVTIVRANDGTDAAWLGYVMSAAQPRIEAMAEGSTGQTELSRSRLSLLELEVPPLEEQRRIAAALGALDLKIDSNRKALNQVRRLGIALLEAACVSGSQEVLIGDVADFHNRRRIPLSSQQRDARPGPYPYYGATGVFGYVDDFLFDEILVLVGEDGSVVNDDGSPVLQYIWGKSWINNHAHPLTGRGISSELLYLTLSQADIRPLVTGAVQPKVSMGNLKSLTITLPSAHELASLEAKVAPLFASWRHLFDEISMLMSLRDSLSQELLSGHIRLSGAEKVLV